MRRERAQAALEVLRAAEAATEPLDVPAQSQGARCRERCSARTCRCPGDPADRTRSAPYAATETGYCLSEGYGRLLDDFGACAGCAEPLRCYRIGRECVDA